MRQLRRKRRPKKQRRGAAFVLLVTAVLLVVLAASQALIRGEVNSRGQERDQAESSMLLRALQLVQQRDVNHPTLIRFPVDNDSSILVQPNAEKTQLVATLYVHDKPTGSVQRPINQER